MSQVQLTELRLRNYRAFADARLVLDDVTFLVGRNGAGKSTLMDAFSFVSEAVTDSLSTALERRGNLEGIRRRQPRQGPRSTVSIAVCLELQQGNHSLPILYGFKVGTDPARSNFVVQQEVLRIPQEWVGRGPITAFDRIQGDFQCTRRDLHPAIDAETLVFPLIARSHESWRVVIEALRLISFHQFSPEAVRREPRIGSEERLSREGSNAGDVLKRLEPEDKKWLEQRLAAAPSSWHCGKRLARRSS